MKCILSRTISYHYQCRFPPTQKEALLCSTCFELLLGCFRSFLVFLARPSTCCNLFEVAPFVTNDDLQNVLTCKFTKNELYVRYCYKVRQVLLQSRVGITEWRNFYYKMGGGVFQSGATLQRRTG